MENPLNKRVDDLETELLNVTLKYDNVIAQLKTLTKSIQMIETTFAELIKPERR